MTPRACSDLRRNDSATACRSPSAPTPTATRSRRVVEMAWRIQGSRPRTTKRNCPDGYPIQASRSRDDAAHTKDLVRDQRNVSTSLPRRRAPTRLIECAADRRISTDGSRRFTILSVVDNCPRSQLVECADFKRRQVRFYDRGARDDDDDDDEGDGGGGGAARGGGGGGATATALSSPPAAPRKAWTLKELPRPQRATALFSKMSSFRRPHLTRRRR